MKRRTRPAEGIAGLAPPLQNQTAFKTEISDPGYSVYRKWMESICLASATITRIIKAQSFIANNPTDFYADIDRAIREVRIEMGMDPPPATENNNV